MADVYPISVTVGNNMKREIKTVPSNQTLRQTLEEAGVDYSRGLTTLDGSTLQFGDLDKSFAEMGITKNTYLISVTKADNAA